MAPSMALRVEIPLASGAAVFLRVVPFSIYINEEYEIVIDIECFGKAVISSK